MLRQEIMGILTAGGMMTIPEASRVADLLADDDKDSVNSPAVGMIFDTLRAKGFTLSQRFGVGGRIVRFLSNGKRTAIVITNDGVNDLYANVDVSTL